MAIIMKQNNTNNPTMFFKQSGSSESAKDLESKSEKIRSSFGSTTISFGDALTTILESLLKLRNEYSTKDWDGYGAEQINERSLIIAERFAMSLPFEIPTPNLYVLPNGKIVFEWRKSKRQIFSVSIGDDNYLSYAGLFGTDTTYGTEYFDDKLPEIVVSNIYRVYSTWEKRFA
jgi:hypothetical protein